MKVSAFNVRIAFQINEVMVDDIGNHKNTWKDYYSCYATVSGEGGSEKNTPADTVYESDIAFSVRYCSELKDADPTRLRVVFKGDVYNIVSIDHMNFKGKSLKFRCRRERNNG